MYTTLLFDGKRIISPFPYTWFSIWYCLCQTAIRTYYNGNLRWFVAFWQQNEFFMKNDAACSLALHDQIHNSTKYTILTNISAALNNMNAGRSHSSAKSGKYSTTKPLTTTATHGRISIITGWFMVSKISNDAERMPSFSFHQSEGWLVILNIEVVRSLILCHMWYEMRQ